MPEPQEKPILTEPEEQAPEPAAIAAAVDKVAEPPVQTPPAPPAKKPRAPRKPKAKPAPETPAGNVPAPEPEMAPRAESGPTSEPEARTNEAKGEAAKPRPRVDAAPMGEESKGFIVSQEGKKSQKMDAAELTKDPAYREMAGSGEPGVTKINPEWPDNPCSETQGNPGEEARKAAFAEAKASGPNRKSAQITLPPEQPRPAAKKRTAAPRKSAKKKPAATKPKQVPKKEAKKRTLPKRVQPPEEAKKEETSQAPAVATPPVEKRSGERLERAIRIGAIVFIVAVVAASSYEIATAPTETRPGRIRVFLTMKANQWLGKPPQVQKAPDATPKATGTPAISLEPATTEKTIATTKEPEAVIQKVSPQKTFTFPENPKQFIVIETKIISIETGGKTGRIFMILPHPDQGGKEICGETSAKNLLELIEAGGIKPGDEARITLGSLAAASKEKYKADREVMAKALKIDPKLFFDIEEYEATPSVFAP